MANCRRFRQPGLPVTLGNMSEVIFLGTGTSVGVPALGCHCDVCTSPDPRNNRTRCAIVVNLPGGTLLIDTPPDLRTQLLREKIDLVHSVVYTHEHADHLFGLDDLRLFPFRLGAAVPLYCTDEVERRIRHSYDYAFAESAVTHPGARPQLEIRNIDPGQPFEVLGQTLVPIPMKHGPNFDVLGFRIGSFAYCTDTNSIGESSLALLDGVETFVVGALRYKPHPTHYCVQEAVEVANVIGAKQTYLTHVGHDIDHQPACDSLPDGIDIAYDGLRFKIQP